MDRISFCANYFCEDRVFFDVAQGRNHSQIWMRPNELLMDRI